jgi:histidinol dehydrogenase
MPLRVWKTADPAFRASFDSLRRRLSLSEGLRAAGESAKEPPLEAVRRIIEDVRARGDAALLDYTREFDRCSLTPGQLRLSDEEIEAAVDRCPPDLLDALRLAAVRICSFQESILLRDPEPLAFAGRRIGMRYRPVDSAGIYVPGGSASLASTVLMAVVPAKVAGVARVAVATPPRPDGTVSDDRLAAAHIAGADAVYRVGSAWAIAALAYGTESVPAVDMIAGPGNIYVTLAKKEVFGQVGIEMLPGPSEVVVIADAGAEPAFVAADMLAQAEHNPGSAILLTDDEPLAGAVLAALEEQLASLPRSGEARAGLERFGALIVAGSLDECAGLANELAPEHLELIVEDADALCGRIRHAGAIFLGAWTPEPVGDYIAGPSHILPTARTARFSSGLSANDFLKRSSIIHYEPSALAEDAVAIATIARAEALEGHARSVEVRTRRRPR